MFPSLYIGQEYIHGNDRHNGRPYLSTNGQDPFAAFLREFGLIMPKPEAVVLFSGGWSSPEQRISGKANYALGFSSSGHPFCDAADVPAYPARGDAQLSRDIEQYFASEGVSCRIDPDYELDNLAMRLLRLLFPEANVPVVVLSVNPRLVPEEQYRIGAALSGLRKKRIFIVGSGPLSYRGAGKKRTRVITGNAAEKQWAFDQWLDIHIETWNLDDLFDYEARAPHVSSAAPDAAQMAPLFILMGAADQTRRSLLLHRSCGPDSFRRICRLFE